MPLQQSPGLDDFQEILPENSASPANRKKPIWLAILGMLFLVMFLFVGNFWQGDITAALRGTGTVRGTVLAQSGISLQEGEAIILGTNLRAPVLPNGSFELNNVPAGKQSLVILDRYTGQEISISLETGQTLDLGTLQFQTTAAPRP